MLVEINLLKRKEFFWSLLEFYSKTYQNSYVQIIKGLSLSKFFQLFFHYRGKFICSGLIPIFGNYYFKIDSRFINSIKKVPLKKILKWNIIDTSKDTCLSFNYYFENRPLLEIHSSEDLEKTVSFLNDMKTNGIISNFEMITD